MAWGIGSPILIPVKGFGLSLAYLKGFQHLEPFRKTMLGLLVEFWLKSRILGGIQVSLETHQDRSLGDQTNFELSM